MKVHAADGLAFSVPIDSVSLIIQHFKKSGCVFSAHFVFFCVMPSNKTMCGITLLFWHTILTMVSFFLVWSVMEIKYISIVWQKSYPSQARIENGRPQWNNSSSAKRKRPWISWYWQGSSHLQGMFSHFPPLLHRANYSWIAYIIIYSFHWKYGCRLPQGPLLNMLDFVPVIVSLNLMDIRLEAGMRYLLIIYINFHLHSNSPFRFSSFLTCLGK